MKYKIRHILVVLIFHSYFTAIIAVMAIPLITAMLVGNKRLYQLVSLLVAIGSVIHFYLELSYITHEGVKNNEFISNLSTGIFLSFSTNKSDNSYATFKT